MTAEGTNPTAIEPATVQAELAVPADTPTETAPDLARSPATLGWALLDRDGYVWPHERNRATGHGEGVWLSRGDVEQRYGPVQEVLLVSPAAGRVLELAQEWWRCRGPQQWLAYRDDFMVTELWGAVDAMVGDRPPIEPLHDLTDEERAAFLAEVEPVPVPAGDGPGWGRATIVAFIESVADDDVRPELRALLADRDRQKTTADAVGPRLKRAIEERDAARSELAEVAADRNVARHNLSQVVEDHRKLSGELAEYRQLFELQWTRMGEATALWRAEAPEDRALIQPDLGALLTWLMQRGDNLEVQVRAYVRLLDAVGDAAPGATDPIEAVQRLRDEANAHEGELGDMRAQLSAAEAEVDRLRALVGEEGQEGWGTVSRADAIRQAEEKHAAVQRLFADLESVKGQWAAEVDRLRGELERLRTWQGLMSLLDEQYPPDVQLGPDNDPGPRILALTRAVDRLRAELERARRDHPAVDLDRLVRDAQGAALSAFATTARAERWLGSADAAEVADRWATDVREGRRVIRAATSGEANDGQ